MANSRSADRIVLLAAAVVTFALSACDDAPSPPSEQPSPSAAAAAPRVTVNGRVQDVGSAVICDTESGGVNIAIGDMYGVAAVLTDGEPPDVESVALGDIDGVPLGFQKGRRGDTATASKTGNTYRIQGVAAGIDVKNPLTPVHMPFEIEVTCP